MLTYGKFRFVKVETEDLLLKTQKLRYETYVKEFGFEKEEDHPGGLEIDDYEDESIHFAALNEEDDVVGTIRLILHSDKGFPIEHATELKLEGGPPPPETTGEISRLVVSKNYRRRREDGRYGLESYIPDHDGDRRSKRPKTYYEKKRKAPVIVIGLYQVMYHESKRLGITHWYMITEQKVYNSFRKFGFLFYAIGEPVYYHGLRTPYLGVIKDMEKRVMDENPFLLRLFLRGLEKEYRPRFGITPYCKMIIRLPYYTKKGWHYWRGRVSGKKI